MKFPFVPVALTAGATLLALLPRHPITAEYERPVIGSARTLQGAYERWCRALARSGNAQRVRIPLSWSKGRSMTWTRARGVARIDLVEQTVAVEVSGFAAEELGGARALDAWLVEYRPGRGAPLEERHVLLGALPLEDGAAALHAPLPRDLVDGFELERIVVSRRGANPKAGGLLFGSPGLFERLYSRDARRARGAADERALGGLLLAVASPTPLSVAAPASQTGDLHSFEQLVGRGERLFFEETFGGNGRTCGTCHPRVNNTTLDPDYIATLAPDDPLFVAETVPALDARQNGGLVFENPRLMRQFGLIVVNADGFGDLRSRFVMRGVPHLLGLSRTITAPAGGVQPPNQRTGWGGDGAPGTGSLREFATGAVVQHLPRSLARVPGVDFRLPTPDELTALEAFQLSLGRSADPDLSGLTFRDPDADAGKAHFGNAVGACFLCHFDAGANAFAVGANSSFDTGVEAFTQNHPDGTGEPRPPDGGFGTNPGGGSDSLVRNPDGSYGNGRFNTPSLVELADTLPAFHSHVTALPGSELANTVEGAVAFYDTVEFDESPGLGDGVPIDLTQTEIDQLGAFLRVLNALENARAALELGERAIAELRRSASDLEHVSALAAQAALECQDAIEVLQETGLHPTGRQDLALARQRFLAAQSGSVPARLRALQSAAKRLGYARHDLLIE